MDTDSNSGDSYSTASGSWAPIAEGNLMVRVFLDCGFEGCNEEPQCSPGDVSGDGIINVLDIVLGSDTPNSDEQCAADANGDGIINVLDIVSIVNAVLGN